MNLNSLPSHSSQTPHLDLINRLDDRQRESFLRVWDTALPHTPRIDFVLGATGWDSDATDALSSTLTDFPDIISSKLDYGECSLRPFEIKVPPGTQQIQSSPYRLNPILSEQVGTSLNSYFAADRIQHSKTPRPAP